LGVGAFVFPLSQHDIGVKQVRDNAIINLLHVLMQLETTALVINLDLTILSLLEALADTEIEICCLRNTDKTQKMFGKIFG
jgi:hypothetical protein